MPDSGGTKHEKSQLHQSDARMAMSLHVPLLGRTHNRYDPISTDMLIMHVFQEAIAIKKLWLA